MSLWRKRPTKAKVLRTQENSNVIWCVWWLCFIFYRYLFFKWINFFFFFGSTACEILVPWPGTEPTYLALKVQGLNHWTTRQVLGWLCFKNKTSPSIVPGMFQDIHFTWSSHQRHKLGTISPLLQGQKTGSRLHQLKFIQLLSGGVRM